MVRLHFTASGRLIAAEGRAIQVWDLNARRRMRRHAGDLIGVDRQGQTLLLAADEGLEAREVDTGAARPLAGIDPGQFALAQRARIQTGTKQVAVEDTLAGVDAYRLALETLIDTGLGHPFCDRVALPDEGQWLAVSVRGEGAWGEWARGYCLGPDGQPRFELLLNHQARRPLLVASPAGRYLLAEHQPGRYELIDPASGETLTVFHLTDPRVGQFAALWDAGPRPRLALHEATQAVGVHALEGQPSRLGAFETAAPIEAAVFITADHLALWLAGPQLAVYSLKKWTLIYELDLRGD